MEVLNYIKSLLAVEEYSFSLSELRERVDKSDSKIKLELAGLVEKNEILNLRQEFYLILTPRYAAFSKTPVQLYAEKLFKFLNRNYYLGLYSAARMHGASHQQIQRDYFITEQPKLRDIESGNIDIRFFTTSNWPESLIEKKRSDAGDYNISSPILTAIDLIHHQSKLGGMNRMLAVLEELLEMVKMQNLIDLLSWYPNRSSLQRLGFLMEEFGMDQILLQALIGHLEAQAYFPILLSPNSKQKPGAVDNKWKVQVNVKLENDL